MRMPPTCGRIRPQARATASNGRNPQVNGRRPQNGGIGASVLLASDAAVLCARHGIGAAALSSVRRGASGAAARR
jgi:hypothetical protein